MITENDEYLVGMYELLDAVEAVIQAADPAKRQALADTIDAYAGGGFGDSISGPLVLNRQFYCIISCTPSTRRADRKINLSLVL
jgi:hypothetical protein